MSTSAVGMGNGQGARADSASLRKIRGRFRESCIFVIQGVGQRECIVTTVRRRRVGMVLRWGICMLAFLMALGPEFAASSPGRESQAATKKGARVESAEFGQMPDGTKIESFTL